jgi:signal transduction histidine kinase
MTSVTGRLPSQDGAVMAHAAWQQHLVAPKVKLGLAEMLLRRDPEKAAATLEQLKGDADEALETLRDLARGIYPPLLADKGLVVALESQARKATVAVTVGAQGVQRYAQDEKVRRGRVALNQSTKTETRLADRSSVFLFRGVPVGPPSGKSSALHSSVQ